MQASNIKRQPGAGRQAGRDAGQADPNARLNWSVSRRVFESTVGDVTSLVAAYELGHVAPRELVMLLRDRLDALEQLVEDGPVSKALECAETAFVEAVMASPGVVNFEAARRDFAGHNQDAAGPESDSGTEFAISNSNSNTKA